MANPPNNPNTPDFPTVGDQAQSAADRIQGFNQQMLNVNNSFFTFIQQTAQAWQGYTAFNDTLDKGNRYFKDSIQLTQQNANALNILSTAAFGASKAFSDFTDTSKISNFSDQFAGIIEDFANLKDITGLVNLGKMFDPNFTKGANDSIEQVKKSVGELASRVLDSADSTLKFQNSFYQLMGTTGQLGRVFVDAGSNLENINNVLQDQAENILGISAATSVSAKNVGQYYQQLGQIPGALQNVTRSTDDATVGTSKLQAVLQFAHGVGRDTTEVIKDMASAYETLGREGEKALDFTARMSQLSEVFGLRVQDTEGFLTKMADTFRFLGDNVDGTAAIFNQFFGNLREGGLGVKPAIDLIEHMTESIAGMTTAQKAFLSSRTGGPGGLLGAVQIEQQLRAGNVEGVMEKLRATFMQQAGGRIITQGQVTNQAEAAQFERQRLLLQSGAFGNLARNDTEATRLLEALASPNRKSLDDVKSILTKDLQQGSTVEQKSLTELQKINLTLESFKIRGGFANLDVLQRGATTAAGGAVAQGLRADRAAATAAGADRGGGGQDRSAGYTQQAIRDLTQGFGNIVQSAIATGRATQDALIAPKTPQQAAQEARQAYNAQMQQLQQQRQQVMKNEDLAPFARQAALQNLKNQEDNLKAEQMRIVANSRRGEMVGTAAHAAAGLQPGQAHGAPTSTVPATHVAPNATPSGKPVNLTVNVYVEGKEYRTEQVIADDGGVPVTNHHK
jgi:hypothetical protein